LAPVFSSQSPKFNHIVRGTARICCCGAAALPGAQRQAAIDRYLLPATPGAQQQTRRTPLNRSMDGTDGRTDGRTLDRYIDPAACELSVVIRRRRRQLFISRVLNK